MATWSDLKDRVQAEMDTEDEDFVSDPELLGYANAGIARVEALILNLNEDYFLAEPVPITLVQGQSAYSLPTDIYAQKIREIIYDNGAENYEVKRIRQIREISNIVAGERYRYICTNSYTNGVKLNIYPAPSEAGNLMTLWYLRNATKITSLSDEIDLPEAIEFLNAFIKEQIINKERNTINAPPSPALMKEEELLMTTLHQRFVDEEKDELTDLEEYVNEVGQ